MSENISGVIEMLLVLKLPILAALLHQPALLDVLILRSLSAFNSTRGESETRVHTAGGHIESSTLSNPVIEEKNVDFTQKYYNLASLMTFFQNVSTLR